MRPMPQPISSAVEVRLEQPPFVQPRDDLGGGAVEDLGRAERIERDRRFGRDGDGAVELVTDRGRWRRSARAPAPVRTTAAAPASAAASRSMMIWSARIAGCSRQRGKAFGDSLHAAQCQEQLHDRDLGRDFTGEVARQRRPGRFRAAGEFRIALPRPSCAPERAGRIEAIDGAPGVFVIFAAAQKSEIRARLGNRGADRVIEQLGAGAEPRHLRIEAAEIGIGSVAVLKPVIDAGNGIGDPQPIEA